MEKRTSVFVFFAQVFMIYGIITGLLNLFCMLFGDVAKGYSPMFSLASEGVSVETSLQFFLASLAVILLRNIFMTDMLIKDMPLPARITAMFTSVFAAMVVFVFLFGWFPVGQALPWVLFVICFAVSCTVSVIISSISERAENRRLEEALKRIKEEN